MRLRCISHEITHTCHILRDLLHFFSFYLVSYHWLNLYQQVLYSLDGHVMFFLVSCCNSSWDWERVTLCCTLCSIHLSNLYRLCVADCCCPWLSIHSLNEVVRRGLRAFAQLGQYWYSTFWVSIFSHSRGIFWRFPNYLCMLCAYSYS